MSTPADPLEHAIRTRIGAGQPVRRTLPGGGRVHVDRPLPFLCVYRRRADRDDPGTGDLVRTQASYLIAPADPALADATGRLIAAVVEELAAARGACLVLELWAGDDAKPPSCFRIHTASRDRLATTIDALADALRAMTLPVTALDVEIVSGGDVAPPGLHPILAGALSGRPDVLTIGLEVPPLFRAGGTVYPFVLRALSRDLMHALQRGFFEFDRVQTPSKLEHFHMLGRRRLVQAVHASDAALVEIGTSFDFLLAVTPVNTEAAWAEFCESGRARTPTLRYRLLTVDPEVGKRRLYDLPLHRLEDPVLAELLRDKRRELDRQLGLLEDRDTPRFLHGSLQLYPPVEDGLLATAREILATIPPGRSAAPALAGPRYDAEAFAAHARAEIDGYRAAAPALAATVEIRDDLASLVVSHGDLLVPRSLDVAGHRVDALLQHEVGTHVLTHGNGRAQPLGVLAAGLAGYEAMQEGLAMFAEYLAGGLDGDRLRLIAARVVAVRRLVEGATFPALVRELTEEHGLSPRRAFLIAVRVFRGGGLSKDAIYLRGLTGVLERVRQGHDLEPLLVGKLGFEQIGLCAELLRRQVLRPPVMTPRWLEAGRASGRLARARAGLRAVDLVDPSGSNA